MLELLAWPLEYWWASTCFSVFFWWWVGYLELENQKSVQSVFSNLHKLRTDQFSAPSVYNWRSYLLASVSRRYFRFLHWFSYDSLKTLRLELTRFLQKRSNFKTRGHSWLKFCREWWNGKLKSYLQKFHFWGSHGHLGIRKSIFSEIHISDPKKILFSEKNIRKSQQIIFLNIINYFWYFSRPFLAFTANRYFSTPKMAVSDPLPKSKGALWEPLSPRPDGVW